MKVSEKLLLSFTENMSALVHSGMSIIDALNITREIDDGKQNNELCSLLMEELKNGEPLSNALEKISSDFNGLYKSLIQIGERTGNTDVVFGKLCGYLMQKREMKEKIRASLTYPIIVFCTAIAVIFIILFFVFPKLSSVFEVLSEGSKNFVLITSNMKRNTYVFMIISSIILMGIGIVFYLYKNNTAVKMKIDFLKFHIPLLSFYEKFIWEVGLFPHIYSLPMGVILCGSGIQIVDALIQSSEVVKNDYFKKEIYEVREEISEGMSFTETLKNKKVFPKYFIAWMGIGETTGNIVQIFDQIYNYYESRSKYYLKQFSTNAESVFILLTGIIVFVMVMQFVLPIFKMLGEV